MIILFTSELQRKQNLQNKRLTCSRVNKHSQTISVIGVSALFTLSIVELVSCTTDLFDSSRFVNPGVANDTN